MGLESELKKEFLRLQSIKEKTEVSLKNVPEGKLRIGKSQGCIQYYHCMPGGSQNGVYLSQKNMGLIQQLAQKAYDKRIIKLVQKRLLQVNRILADYKDDEIENCFLREHPEKQKLIKPVELTKAQHLGAWMSEPYKGRDFSENSPVFLTNNGLRVRSKSEKIMADYFESQGISFKYECPLYLKTYGTIYPDFTFLSPYTGEEIYWEHEGMMDNPEYARSAVKKIELYETNLIYPGERLILTYETSDSGINTRIIQNLTKKYLVRGV